MYTGNYIYICSFFSNCFLKCQTKVDERIRNTGGYLNRRTNWSTNNHCILTNFTCAILSSFSFFNGKTRLLDIIIRMIILKMSAACQCVCISWKICSPPKCMYIVHTITIVLISMLIPEHLSHWKYPQRMRFNRSNSFGEYWTYML